MIAKIRKQLKQQKGFTLIELLVVIAIIGVLAAIAVPKFADATATSGTAKIQADLQAIDSASQIYQANNSGTIPPDVATLVTAKLLTSTPAAPSKAMITGTSTDTSGGAYGIDSTTGRGNIKIGNATYTADTIKSK